MQNRIRQAALLIALMLAPAAFAGVSEDLDAAAKVRAGDHAAWIKARDKLVGGGDAVLEDLKAAAADKNWTAEGWTRALAAETARLRIQKPDLAKQVDAPRGIDPEFYLKTRLAKPVCQRDFTHMGAEAVPLLVERYRYTLDAKPFSEGEAGNLERETLARALLATPGQAADARARFALAEVLKNNTLPELWRQDAAVSYGQSGGKEAVSLLGMVIDDGKQPQAVRQGCAWALGRVPQTEALEAIRARLGDGRITGGETGPAMVRALVNGLGVLGSSWAWKARGETEKARAEAIREGCARLLVDTLKNHPAESAQISEALVLTAWNDSLGWLEELAKDKAENLRAAAAACIAPLKEALAREK